MHKEKLKEPGKYYKQKLIKDLQLIVELSAEKTASAQRSRNNAVGDITCVRLATMQITKRVMKGRKKKSY